MSDYLSELNEARAALNESPWLYCGDVNLEEGGFYWREDGADDYVMAVRITPCSDADGPCNLFWVETGTIYMPEDRRDSYLSVIGVKPEEATRFDYVYAALAYYGIERGGYDCEHTLQIGPEEEGGPGWGGVSDPEELPEDTDLRRYVEETFLD